VSEEFRSYVQLAAAVITAISTTMGAIRLWKQDKQYKLERAEARRQGIDPDQAERS
jgi:hypothetical protein